MLADRLDDFLKASTAMLGICGNAQSIVHAQHLADSENAGIVQMIGGFRTFASLGRESQDKKLNRLPRNLPLRHDEWGDLPDFGRASDAKRRPTPRIGDALSN